MTQPRHQMHASPGQRRRRIWLAALCATILGAPAMAGTLEVRVIGIVDNIGEVGCALYSGPDGFPMQPRKAVQVWQKADPTGVTCRFDRLAPGSYALALSHDRNGNRKTDSNFLGMPKEAWGVTNDRRPSMRAPRFDEASVTIAEGQTVSQTIRIAK